MNMEVEAVAIMELSQEDMERLEEEAKKMEAQKQAILSSLAQGIQDKYQSVSSRRLPKEREWLDSTRLLLGSLSADRFNNPDNKLQPLDNTRSSNKPRHNLVNQKCKVAIAQSWSSQFAGGDKNWDIFPTPSPENDPAIVGIAAENMEKEIEDQLTEEDYGYKSRTAMEYRVNLGTGILKGPVPARDAKLAYQLVDDGMGNILTIPEYRVKNRPVLTCVNPWFFFPDDTVNDIRDAEFAIELHHMSKTQIAKLKKNPGFFPEAIDELLKLEPETFANDTFSEYSTLTDSGTNFLRNKFAMLEYHGPITVDQLGALGIEPSYDPLNDVYFGEVWVCQGIVVRAELEAISGLYELPYMVCPWEKDPNSIFGFSLPLCIRDPQRIAQATLDMILDNASVSSGPIGIINTKFMEPLDGDWTLAPHKIFGSTDYTLGDVRNAMQFLEVPNMTAQLFPVLQFAREVAQEESGVPQLAGGLQSPQVGSDSATGLAIIQQNMTTVSDMKNEEWDDMVVERLIRRMYHWNMQYNPKPEIIGDFDVDVKSSSEYRNKQLFVRDVEKLSVESAQNPELAKVLNMAELQRLRLSMMHIPSKTIIKTPEQIAADEQAAAQNPPPPDPALLKVEAEFARLEVEKQKLALEAQRMQFEMSQAQRREEMDHAERMNATYARHLEAEARVTEAMANREIEMLKLAQKDNEYQGWLMAELQKSTLQAEAQKFTATVGAEVKFKEQALTAAELSLKARTGSGI